MTFFFFNDTATTEIYTLSLHDALPIFDGSDDQRPCFGPVDRHAAQLFEGAVRGRGRTRRCAGAAGGRGRSEEHTSELQSRQYLVCRLLLEKKKTMNFKSIYALT